MVLILIWLFGHASFFEMVSVSINLLELLYCNILLLVFSCSNDFAGLASRFRFPIAPFGEVRTGGA